MNLLFVLQGLRSKYIDHIICHTMVHKGSNCQICPKFRACYHPSHIYVMLFFGGRLTQMLVTLLLQ